MDRWKIIAPIMLSLVIALAGSVFLYNWVGDQMHPQEIIKIESDAVEIAVAAADLTLGTSIRPEMIHIKPFLKESIPSGYFISAVDLTDRVVTSTIKQGEPIVEHRLAPIHVKTGGVSAILKEGKRALAVKGDKVIGISGFVKPGNRVDVLVTLKDPKTKTEKTKIVLENILILATGTQIEDNGKMEPRPVDVYTLEVSPEEGEILALASSKGKLQFSLRNAMDDETVLTKGATITKALAALSDTDQAPKKKNQKKWSKPKTYTVEVIKGHSVAKKDSRFNTVSGGKYSC